MPKRACPFEDNFQPQCKMHVGEKDVELNNKNCMSKIYDRTLDLLFKGAKTQKQNLSGEEEEVTDVLYDCNICKSTALATTKCWFCDNKLCQNCEQICTACNEAFCKLCSVLLYNEQADIRCLNCLNN